jgi:hypothetical protein
MKEDFFSPNFLLKTGRALLIFLALLVLFQTGVFWQQSRKIKRQSSSLPLTPTSTPSNLEKEAQDAPTPTAEATLIPIAQTAAPTPTPSITSIKVNLVPQYTKEPIESFQIAIRSWSDYKKFLEFSGTGDSYTFKNIDPDEYEIEAEVADFSHRCSVTRIKGSVPKGESPYYFKIAKGEKLEKDIPIYPYLGVISVLTQDYYPVVGAKVAVVDRSGSEEYYSTTTDEIGRAAVYTLNPLPQYILIEYNDLIAGAQRTIKEISDGLCLWRQEITIPIILPRGRVKVSVKNQTDDVRAYDVSLYKQVPELRVEMNAITDGGGLGDDSYGRFRQGMDWDSQYGDLVSVRSEKGALMAGEEKEVVFQAVPVGKYFVLGKTTSYLRTKVYPVEITKADEEKSVSLVFILPVQ